MNGKKEIRNFTCEMRAEADEKRGSYITGRPIVYNRETDLGWLREVIDPGALDLDSDLKDVRFLVGHDTSSIPLARSRNNNENSTMQLMADGEGLAIRANLDTENNQRAKELYSAIERGDISGMSFMFTVDKDSWEGLDEDKPLRHITHISKVFEVSAVTFPAYEETTLEAADESGALESAKASLESARQQRKAEEQAEERRRAEERLDKAIKEERAERRRRAEERLDKAIREAKNHEVRCEKHVHG